MLFSVTNRGTWESRDLLEDLCVFNFFSLLVLESWMNRCIFIRIFTTKTVDRVKRSKRVLESSIIFESSSSLRFL